MLRVASVNVNGIRAACRKGMQAWLAARDVDLLGLQEVRASDEVVQALLGGGGLHVAHTESAAKGRAGVAVLGRLRQEAVRIGNGDPYFDASGRWIEVDVELASGKRLTMASAYVHAGDADSPRQVEKYRFLDAMTVRLRRLCETSDYAVVVGDLNVGHTELDIKNWRGNRGKSGFLPQERAYFDRFADELGWVDVGRAHAGEVAGPYTWWSYRGQAFDNDAGWRIDYQLATPELAALVTSCTVDRAAAYDQRWSDHAPVVVDYDV